MKKQVTVLIPIHEEEPTALEKISLSQTLSILHNYPITFQTKEGLNTRWYEEFCHGKATVSFERFKWNGLQEYKKLLLSPDFYRRFTEFEYILICHLDSFVFRDELAKWCEANYDYVGSFVYNTTRASLPSRFAKVLGFAKPEYIANGGFGLRKVESFIYLTRSSFVTSKLFLWGLRHKDFHEDLFISQLPPKALRKFRMAPKSSAQQFGAAFEIWDEKTLPFRRGDSGRLPFGVHGWFKYNSGFWKQYVREYGHNLTYTITIFYIDSDVDNCELFVKAVNVSKGDKDVNCEVAHNSEEALSKIGLMPNKPACIFFDINLPKMGGREFVKSTLAEAKFHGVPIVAYSNSINPVDIEYFHNHRVFHYVPKPTRFEAICEHVTWVLGVI